MPRDSARPAPPPRPQDIRIDLRLIADMVTAGSRVLDVGCQNGELLETLWREKRVDGRGIEISQEGVHNSVSRGLSVVQGDADTDLSDYPTGAFDFAILSHTLQAMHDPKGVLDNLVRIGRQAIVSFPNFGHWRVRVSLLLKGRMPVTSHLSYEWYETPNIHFCTIADFVALCRQIDIGIDASMILAPGGRVLGTGPGAYANLFGEQVVFLLSRKDGD
ncbi:MAG: methionine biosynthesis protein MetW [Inquilinus sp.]|nr:methionine biosynthesis protein MetW [Inquilinus sp.]